MALKLLQSGSNPLGQFDGVDNEYLTLKGGEVLGYIQNGTARTAVGFIHPAHTGNRPIMLADEGVAGYGTLFGTVVGGVGGQVATGGTVLGPHTATGSGKVTCWDKPGLYAVSLDACDVDATLDWHPGRNLNAFTLDGEDGSGTWSGPGVVPPFSTPGSKAGFLTASNTNVVNNVASFVSFETNGSLVNTPNKLVAALNSGSGNGLGQFQYMVIHFHGGYIAHD